MLVMTSLSKPAYKKYILSIAHTDYTMSVGGVEKLIGEHEIMFREKQISYVFLCPMKPDIGIYKVYIDGVCFGNFKISSVLRIMSAWDRQLLGIHIHHIWLWHVEDVLKFISSIDSSYYVFLHDYYFICHHYNLINSSGDYCGEGVVSKSKCKGCAFYEEENQRFLERLPILRMLEKKNAVFVAPSEYVRELWTATFPQFNERTITIKHQVFSNFRNKKKDQHFPYKIAFIGAQTKEKGWPVFIALKEYLANDPRYQFFHFGTARERVDGILNIPVSFMTDGNDAMKQAICDYAVDFAVFYTQWPETYNYTCYEAYSGGALLITNKISGNIQQMVRENGCGIVVKDVSELFDLFHTGKAITLLENYTNSETFRVPDDCITNNQILDIMDSNSDAVFHSRHSNLIFEPGEAIRIEIIRFLKNVRQKCLE